jgi:hypothetical protein
MELADSNRRPPGCDVRERARPVVPVRRNREFAGILSDAGEPVRSRANRERCHCCHAPTLRTPWRASPRAAHPRLEPRARADVVHRVVPDTAEEARLVRGDLVDALARDVARPRCPVCGYSGSSVSGRNPAHALSPENSNLQDSSRLGFHHRQQRCERTGESCRVPSSEVESRRPSAVVGCRRVAAPVLHAGGRGFESCRSDY